MHCVHCPLEYTFYTYIHAVVKWGGIGDKEVAKK